MSRSRRLLTATLLVAIVLACAWWAYLPGLTGNFHFDDFSNLQLLGSFGPIDNWPIFWRYITSGTADPTGRPLAMLSFLIDARNWPADPRPFLRTNILLHLVNGALLFWLLRQLGFAFRAARAVADREPGDHTLAWRIHLAALLGAAFWLLHPLLVSTTLYIVQREAMLPATFTLLGLIAWLRGRRGMLAGRSWRGLAWLMLGLGVCTTLGVLSKANGILLPALALVIEWTVLRQRRDTNAPKHDVPRRSYRWVMWILAGLPTLFVAAYLVHAGYNGVMHGVSRQWTLGQRLLTEPRVLLDYLQLLWMPRPFTPGLFNDQIRASMSLLHPWTTVPCLLAVISLIVGACVVRKRLPAVALAVLFYFVGQALESSTIALELYFEHRNYLPAMLMFWPLALWLCGVHQVHRRHPRSATGDTSQEKRHGGKPLDWRWIKLVLAALLVVGLATMTHARASVWGHTRTQALLWARLNPDSPRAQANAVLAYVHVGETKRSARQLRKLLRTHPRDVLLAFDLFGVECKLGNVPPATLLAAKNAMATARRTGVRLTNWFDQTLQASAHPSCPQLNLTTLTNLVHAGQSNPTLMQKRSWRKDMNVFLGHIALTARQPSKAFADFNRALYEDTTPGTALEQAALLGSHGYPRRGLEHLAYYRTLAPGHLAKPRFGMPRIHAWVLHHQHYWRDQMAYLEGVLRTDAAHDAAADRAPQAPGTKNNRTTP